MLSMTYGNYPDLSDIQRILVIKLRHLGDVLLTSPFFSILHEQFPRASIDAYIYGEAKPMLEGHPGVREIIINDRSIKSLSLPKKLLKEWKVLRYLKKNRYDLIFNLTEGDRGAIVSKYCRAKVRVGFDPEGGGYKGKRKAFTHIVKNCPTSRHTVEKNLDALRRIGIFPTPEQRELFFFIPDEAKTKMFSLLKEKGLSPKKYYLIHPASRWRFKCLPIKTVRRVVLELLDQDKDIIIVSGKDPYEREMVDSIIQGISSNRLINLAGKVNLKELAALILYSQCVFSIDSMCFHMANALKVKVVAAFGPTSDVVWGPWRNPYAKVVTKNYSCRPCNMDGCGGSKVSDCLSSLDPDVLLKALLHVESLATIGSPLQNSTF